MTHNIDAGNAERRKVLTGSIKLLVSIGFVFLLVPFFKSIPWPEEATPENSTLILADSLTPGRPLLVTLKDGSQVFVTRPDAATTENLQAISPDILWYGTAPGLLDQDYLVVQAHTSQDEAITYLGPQANWSGGFVAKSGAAWDVAGRALKPFPGHPGGNAMKVSNLIPAPWRRHDDGVLLMPAPVDTSTAQGEDS